MTQLVIGIVSFSILFEGLQRFHQNIIDTHIQKYTVYTLSKLYSWQKSGGLFVVVWLTRISIHDCDVITPSGVCDVSPKACW